MTKIKPFTYTIKIATAIDGKPSARASLELKRLDQMEAAFDGMADAVRRAVRSPEPKGSATFLGHPELRDADRVAAAVRESLDKRGARTLPFCDEGESDASDASAAVKREAGRRTSSQIESAFEQLLAQIVRLRGTPCPTMEFVHNGGPEEQLAALERELAELKRETIGSPGWVAEALDVFTVALHLLIAAGWDVEQLLRRQARKLEKRLDHIDAGGTWEEAKRAEN